MEILSQSAHENLRIICDHKVIRSTIVVINLLWNIFWIEKNAQNTYEESI